MVKKCKEENDGMVDQITPVDVHHVQVGGEISRRIDLTVQNNLLAINVDRDFLLPFKQKHNEGGYIGLGKLIDSFVRISTYIKNDNIMTQKKYLINETIRTQEPDGYIGIMQPDKRMWTLWDIHEMSYIIFGLVSDYRYFVEQASLESARKLADYIVEQWMANRDRIPGGGRINVHMAVIGIESAMLALYQQTGEQKYLNFCIDFRKLPEWEAPIVLGRWGQIDGHAYAYMCRCVAQLRLYRIQPDSQLLLPSKRIIEFLTKQDGLVITGAVGDHECWHDTQEGTKNLGETCATAYLIRLMDEMLRLEGNSLYGDIMERVVYNTLFAAQSPDGRQIRYYTPFDGPRTYFPTDTYCCPGNYRRIIVELPSMIYYQLASGLVVNLYTTSTVKIKLESGAYLNVQQKTDYPRSGQVTIYLNPSKPTRSPLWLRIPRWCTKAQVKVNHQPFNETIEPGKFLRIDHEWKTGDQVLLDFPMSWRLVKGRKAQAGRVAVMRGPLLFCLNRSRHKELADVDLRLIVIDPSSLEGPIEGDEIHESGVICHLRAWSPGSWYPHGQTDLSLVLTEFTDPGGEFIYFKVPNPRVDTFVDDDLIQT